MKKKKKKRAEEEVIEQVDAIGGDKEETVGNVKDTEGAEGDTGEQTATAKEDTSEEQRDPVEVLEEKLKVQKDKYIRLMAEFDNFKRRTSKEYERIVESANERLMLDIIEVRENFERALAMTSEDDDYSTFLEGMKLIFGKLEDNLKKNGLTVFTEVGDEFDPEIHDAMMKTPHKEIPEDHIVEIYAKGYKLKNYVIKHAKVIVSSGASEEREKSEAPENKEDQSEEMVAD